MHSLIRMGLLCLGLLTLAPATAWACGDEGQGPCGGSCDWYIKGTCPFCIPWCHRNPQFCHADYDLKTEYVFTVDAVVPYQVCRKKPVPPPPPPPLCGPACQAQKINAALGNPAFASLNRSARINRAQAGLSSSDMVHLDIGGEGSHHFQSRCDGHDTVVNVNPNTEITSGHGAGQPIPNLVLGYGQNLPFQNGFADEICAQSVPFTAEWAEEMARVIKPGGKLAICGKLDDAGYAEGLLQLQAHGLQIAATNNFGFERDEVVLDVPRSFSYSPIAIPGKGQCPSLAASLNSSLEPRSSRVSPTLQQGGCEVDLMVLYTATAEQEAHDLGLDIEQLAHERVNAMNDALTNTQLATRVRLVHLGKIDFDESLEDRDMERINKVLRGTYPPNPANAEALKRIHGMRETVGADLVSLFVMRTATIGSVAGSACGVGFDTLTRDNGYSTIRWQCLNNSQYALAHEAGHNFGLHHDRFTLNMGANDDPTGYNYGYSTVDGNGFWTIMAYATLCAQNNKPFCGIIPYYSTPDLQNQGRPMGSATANNKRAIEENAPHVAAYLPRAPDQVFSPQELDFGTGLTSVAVPPGTLELYNTTGADLLIRDVVYTGPGVFSIHGAGTTCTRGRTLEAWSVCEILVDFTPTATTPYSGTIQVSFEGGTPSISAQLRGEGLSGQAQLVLSVNSEELGAAEPIDFGNVLVSETGGARLTFENTGTIDLTVSTLSLPASNPFQLNSDGIDADEVCPGFPGAFRVPAHSACRGGMSFKPHQTGTATTTLTIKSNDAKTPQRTVTVKGFGVHDEL